MSLDTTSSRSECGKAYNCLASAPYLFRCLYSFVPLRLILCFSSSTVRRISQNQNFTKTWASLKLPGFRPLLLSAPLSYLPLCTQWHFFFFCHPWHQDQQPGIYEYVETNEEVPAKYYPGTGFKKHRDETIQTWGLRWVRAERSRTGRPFQTPATARTSQTEGIV